MADEKVIVIQGKYNSIAVSISVVLIVVLLVVGYFLWKKLDNQNSQLQNQLIEFKKINDDLVRSSTTWATKADLESNLKNLLTKAEYDALKNDISSLNARLEAVGKTVGTIKEHIASLEPSDKQGPENTNVVKCDNGKLIDTYEYTKNPQIKELTDSNQAPVAGVEFNAAKEKPWSYEVYKREHKLLTTVSKTENGQLIFYHKLDYSVPTKDPNKFYPIDIISSDYIQIPSVKRMFWFNPVLDINFFIGGRALGFANGIGRSENLLSIGADLGLSFSSYGETKVDSLFRLWRVGVGYDAEREAAHLSFAPFSFNVGKYIPLMSNFYVAPQAAVDTGGGLIVGMGIGPQL